MVSTILKHEDRREVSKYWSVTMLGIISKVPEKLLFKVLRSLFKRNVNGNQFGFPPRKLIVTPLLCSLASIYDILAADNATSFLMLFVFSKAFDIITHSVPLSKILEIETSKNLVIFNKRLLTGTLKHLKINNELLPPLLVPSDVLQGSALGPLQLLIYINDLPDTVFSFGALLFEDDLKLIH